MLDRLFSPEGPVVNFIFRVRDLIILNVITLICMIPIFTIGPALKALAFTCLKIVREEDGNVVKTYFKNFKINFGQSVVFGLVCLLLVLIAVGDIYALILYWKVFSPILKVPAFIALLFIAAILVYAVPMQGRFLNPLGRTFSNAFWAALAKPGKTAIMLLCWLLIPIMIYLVSENFVVLAVALGFSLPNYLNALVYEPFFRKAEETITEKNEENVETEETQETEN